MVKKFRSDALESIHDSARALLEIGAIDNATLGDFEVACTSEVPDETKPPRSKGSTGRNNNALKGKVMPDAGIS